MAAPRRTERANVVDQRRAASWALRILQGRVTMADVPSRMQHAVEQLMGQSQRALYSLAKGRGE